MTTFKPPREGRQNDESGIIKGFSDYLFAEVDGCCASVIGSRAEGRHQADEATLHRKRSEEALGASSLVMQGFHFAKETRVLCRMEFGCSKQYRRRL